VIDEARDVSSRTDHEDENAEKAAAHVYATIAGVGQRTFVAYLAAKSTLLGETDPESRLSSPVRWAKIACPRRDGR